MTTYQETRTLDLLKERSRAGGVKPIVLRRGETGQSIAVSVTNDGTAFNLTGYTASFCAVNADRGMVKRSATVSNAAGGLVTFSVTSDLTAAPGSVFVAYIELTKGSDIATTDTLPFVVLDNVDAGELDAEEYQDSIRELIAAVRSEAVAQATGAVSDALGDMQDDYEAAEAARDAAYAAAEAARCVDYVGGPFSIVDGAVNITYYEGTL